MPSDAAIAHNDELSKVRTKGAVRAVCFCMQPFYFSLENFALLSCESNGTVTIHTKNSFRSSLKRAYCILGNIERLVVDHVYENRYKWCSGQNIPRIHFEEAFHQPLRIRHGEISITCRAGATLKKSGVLEGLLTKKRLGEFLVCYKGFELTESDIYPLFEICNFRDYLQQGYTDHLTEHSVYASDDGAATYEKSISDLYPTDLDGEMSSGEDTHHMHKETGSCESVSTEFSKAPPAADVSGCGETDDSRTGHISLHDESGAPGVPTSDIVQTPTSDIVPKTLVLADARNGQVLGQGQIESESENATASCDKVDNTNSGRASRQAHAIVAFASGETKCLQSSDSVAANEVIQSRSGRHIPSADFIFSETAEQEQNYSEEAQCDPGLSAQHSDKCLEARDRALEIPPRNFAKKNGACATYTAHAVHAAETFSGRANAGHNIMQTPNDPKNKKKEKPVQKNVERRHSAQTYVSKLEMNKIKSNRDLREMLNETINNGYESQFEKASKLRITR